MTYDPAFMATASCRSSITYIDGDKGILEYRGYPIEQLAEKSSYLEVAYLLIHGELPTSDRARPTWRAPDITIHTFVHENVKEFMQGFRYDAHPMGMLAGVGTGALSTFYPEAERRSRIAENRYIQTIRLLAKMPTLAAFSYRHNRGMPYVYPDNDLSYAGNFLSMIYKIAELKYQPDPRLEHALDVLFILHADHEQNCSTSAVRLVGSSQVDPYSSIAGGVAALYGPLHGGANEAVLRMLRRIGRPTATTSRGFIEGVKSRQDEKLMGFGHRVYKNFDPRAKIVKTAVEDVFEVTGKNPLLDIATELEKIALEDDYFVSRKLYPNVDFYSGLIYEALGMPVEMFPVLFAIGRTSGWIAQWLEMIQDPEQKISRPRQIYTGGRGHGLRADRAAVLTAPGRLERAAGSELTCDARGTCPTRRRERRVRRGERRPQTGAPGARMFALCRSALRSAMAADPFLIARGDRRAGHDPPDPCPTTMSACVSITTGSRPSRATGASSPPSRALSSADVRYLVEIDGCDHSRARRDPAGRRSRRRSDRRASRASSASPRTARSPRWRSSSATPSSARGLGARTRHARLAAAAVDARRACASGRRCSPTTSAMQRLFERPRRRVRSSAAGSVACSEMDFTTTRRRRRR